ncbi:TetR family transcriptional regulator C-terminal domain-containing protein [Streptomyces bobili]|uniref:TetR family transcriptional regulator C-terminal domain-containing protein n=1 Tax=Streptomyces bobili TaxID=67280 RepID=UPI003F4DE1B8
MARDGGRRRAAAERAGGCPLGSLSSELSDDHPWARDALAANRTVWSEAIRAGLTAMVDDGVLRRETDAQHCPSPCRRHCRAGLYWRKPSAPPTPSKRPWTP